MTNKNTPKTPTLREKVEMYETLLHHIQACGVCCNRQGFSDAIDRINSWSYAHRAGNGELSDREVQQRVNAHFWGLMTVPKMKP